MGSLCAVGERGFKTGLRCGHLGSPLCCVALGKTLSCSGPHHPNLKTTKLSPACLLYPLQSKGSGRRFLGTREVTPVAVS